MKVNRKDFVYAKINIHLTPDAMLKTLRELQGLTQQELSDLTGIPQSNISALENNSKMMGRQSALVLAKALKVHPGILLFPDYDQKAA